MWLDQRCDISTALVADLYGRFCPPVAGGLITDTRQTTDRLKPCIVVIVSEQTLRRNLQTKSVSVQTRNDIAFQSQARSFRTDVHCAVAVATVSRAARQGKEAVALSYNTAAPYTHTARGESLERPGHKGKAKREVGDKGVLVKSKSNLWHSAK